MGEGAKSEAGKYDLLLYIVNNIFQSWSPGLGNQRMQSGLNELQLNGKLYKFTAPSNAGPDPDSPLWLQALRTAIVSALLWC